MLGGFWFVGYGLAPAYSAPPNEVRGFLADAAGASCSNFGIVTTGSATVRHPTVAAVAASPPQFLVAWQDDAAGTIRARRMERQGTCGSGAWLVTPTEMPIATPGVADQPALAFARDKCLPAFHHRSTPIALGRIWVKGLTMSGAAAGLERIVSNAGLSQVLPAAAGEASGGAASDEALLVWTNGGVHAQRWEAVGTGTVTNLGGSCGTSGFSDFASYGGTPAIGTTFTIDLLAPTAPILALVIGFASTPFACGPCTLVPRADIVLPPVNPTAITLPLEPGLLGIDLIAQWVQARPCGCAAFAGLGLANALRFSIGE
jgi:hypothetical protein